MIESGQFFLVHVMFWIFQREYLFFIGMMMGSSEV